MGFASITRGISCIYFIIAELPLYTIRTKIRKIVGTKNFRYHATVRKAASCKPVWNVRAYPAYVAGNRKGIFQV